MKIEHEILVAPENYQAREITNLLCDFSDAVFEIQNLNANNSDLVPDVIGSQTLIRFNDRYYSVLTSHQRKLMKSGNPRIALIERKILLGSASFIDFSNRYPGLIDQEYDLCVLDFTRYVERGLLPVERFFALGPSNVLTGTETVVVGSNPGFPKENQEFSSSCEIELIDGIEVPQYQLNGIHLKPWINTVNLVTPYTDQIEHAQWQQVYVNETDPNGRSGSPIFAFTRFGDLMRVKFAGVVFLGGYDKVTAYTGPTIVNVLRKAEEIIRRYPHPDG